MLYGFITKYTDIFCGKNQRSFSHFFDKKYWHILDINVRNFNETLTKDIFSFEQPGSGRLYLQAIQPSALSVKDSPPMDLSPFFSAIFYKGNKFCDIPFCILAGQRPSKIGSKLKEHNILLWGAN